MRPEAKEMKKWMPKRENISMSVIRRMPRYYRFLGLLQADGIQRISSTELSRRMGLTASQIRQDLNCFGGFGQQGYGYNVGELRAAVGSILGVHRGNRVILIGAGNIGRALANNVRFPNLGFELAAIFDADRAMEGQMAASLPVRHIDSLDEYCRKNTPAAAVLTLPTEAAPVMVARLWELGVRGFWNFTSYDILLRYPEAIVENVHLGDSLMTLSYKLSAKQG